MRKTVSPEKEVDGSNRNGFNVLLFFEIVSKVAGSVADEDSVDGTMQLSLVPLLLL